MFSVQLFFAWGELSEVTLTRFWGVGEEKCGKRSTEESLRAKSQFSFH
jgi:hypothetical protein